MRRHDDPVEVRRGQVAGAGGPVEGPEQFLWHGRLWKVCAVVAHWVETGPWWQSSGARAVLGADEATAVDGQDAPGVVTLRSPGDLLGEREIWRVEAARGVAATGSGRGVFDLAFDWTAGSWRLTCCLD